MAFQSRATGALFGTAALVCIATAAPAQAQVRSFNIAAQPAPGGVAAFSRQADIQLLIAARHARGRSTNAVIGSYTVAEGLRILLANTGLTAQATGERTYTIVPDALGNGSGADGADEVSDPDAQEIIVTGTNISGVRDTASPTQVVTRQEIERTGFSTVEELFESLPQNFDEVTPEGRFANEGGSLLRGLNNSRVTAVDLRGLGAQSTLTLLNGTRQAGSVGGRVFDIAAVPLSAIERIEIVTGGRSAIYGADAVAGVVNLVTRRSFDGAESQMSFGLAGKGGGERLQLSQLVGHEGARGGIVAAYDFTRFWALELGDAGLLSLQPNPEIGLTQLTLNAQADTRRHSGYVAGHYDLADGVELHADGLYSTRRFDDFSLRFFEGATEDSFTDVENRSEHLGFRAGIDAELGNAWKLRLNGAWSRVTNRSDSSLFIDLGFFQLSRDTAERNRASMAVASLVADGPLPPIAGITPRLAIGVEWRRDGFRSSLNGTEDADLDRTVRSAFAELLLPLAEDGPDGLRRLELSLAGRLDDYSDVGDTYNPQIGLIWEPIAGLTLRGSYSTAFRAPALVELQGSTDAFLELVTNPAGGAPVPVLFIQGENPDLRPEEAETWTAGVDWQPAFARGLRLSASYFDISYEGRIEQPSVNADRELVLVRADRFPGLLLRTPTAAEAQAYLDRDADGLIDNDTGVAFDPETDAILSVFPNLALFDNRTGNVAVETVKGLDFSIDATVPTRIGELDFGLNLTHLFEHERRVTPTSPAFSLLNEVGKAADTRLRLRAGWSRGAWGAYAYLNYVDDYANPFSTPASRMASWTTVDLTVRFDGSQLSRSGFLNGFTAALSVQNLLGSDPPLFPNSLQGVLYDSTNANPFGRYFSLRLTKRW